MDIAQVPANWPVWVAVIVTLILAFRKDLMQLLPKAIQEQFKYRAKLHADRQEHNQELEEVSVEALAQHAVTAQMQLINVNEHLVKFITNQIDARLNDLERTMAVVRGALDESRGKDTIVQVELSRVADSMLRQETVLENIKTLLATLVSSQQVMREDE